MSTPTPPLPGFATSPAESPGPPRQATFDDLGTPLVDTTFVVIDLDRRLDETALRVLDHADTIYVVMTADLACLKNVRLLLETIERLIRAGGLDSLSRPEKDRLNELSKKLRAR